MNFADVIRAAFFEPNCCICREKGSAFCTECAPFVHERVDEYLLEAELPLRCLGAYEGNLRDAVLELKEGRRDVAASMAGHLAERVSDLDWLSDATLVPMPTAAHRRRLRGVDVAAFLAKIIAERLELRSVQALYSRSWRAQRGRNRAQRLDAAGRFIVQRATELQGSTIVLVDDVVTTGATMREAAAVLRRSGMHVCGALAIARTHIVQ